MTCDLARRLDKIEAAYDTRATVLRLEDGTKAFLPLGAMIDVFLGFTNLAHEGELSWDGEPIPEEWIRAYATSVPQPDEGQLTEAVRVWCQHYLRGEEL